MIVMKEIPNFIVIDSIAAPFRVLDFKVRNRLLSELLGHILLLAHGDCTRRRLFICTNQMTNDAGTQMPALGEIWESVLATRMTVERMEKIVSQETGSCVRKLKIIFSENIAHEGNRIGALFSPGCDGLIAFME
ncbi:hypothetical protein ACOME3_003163 [Neoechinorhynchus agilis]